MNWLKVFSLGVFFIFTCFSGLYSQETPKPLSENTPPPEIQTTIIGTVKNPFQKSLELRFFTDYISFDEQLFEIPIGIDNQFAMTFLLKEPTVASIIYYGMEFNVYFEPGDELHVNFDALDLWGTLQFGGKGAIHNQYLIDNQKEFGQWNTSSIAYEIGQRKPLDFRRLMDRILEEKQSYYKSYPAVDQFSSAFENYATADIQYWWGYHLLRYRTEHPLVNGLNAPMVLPQDYYLFLNQLLVSNDEALLNRNYLFFIDQYLAFRNENPPELNGPRFYLNSMVITAPSMMVLAEPDEPPVLAELSKGQRVIYMGKKSEKKSKILIGDEMVEDYWYKVRTVEGIDGWISGVGARLDELSNRPVNIDESGQAVYRNANKLLRGKVLSYTIANDIFWRAQLSKPEIIKPEIDNYLKAHRVYAYQQVVKAAYQEAVDRTRMSEREVYGSTNYLTVSKAEILSSHGEKVKEPQPIAGATKIVEDVEKPTPSIAKKPAKVKKRKIRKPKEVVSTKAEKAKERRRRKSKKGKSVVAQNANKAEKIQPTEPVKERKTQPEPIVQQPAPAIASTPSAPPSEKTTEPGLSPTPAIVAKETPKVNPTITERAPTTYLAIDAQPRETANKFQKIKLKSSAPLSRNLKLVLYEDPILLGEKEIKLTYSNSATAVGTFKFGKIQYGYLSYGQDRVGVYLEKGGSLQVTFDPHNFMASLEFTGDDAAANNYLLAYAKYKQPIDEALKSQIKDAGPDAFKQFMSDKRKTLHFFLKEYKKNHKLDRQFLEFAKADIDYWYGYHLLNYLWEHPLLNGMDAPIDASRSYFSFFSDLMISNEFALPNLNYIYFLDQFIDYQLNLKSNESLSDKELVKKYLKGDPLDYYTSKLLSTDCKRGKALTAGPEIQSFIDQCDNEVYNNVLRQVYNEAKGLSYGDEAPNFTLKDMSGKLVQLKDYRGKVVYLDFWATWCSPCVMQMKNSKQWKKEFAGRDDVVFLYLSLDKEESSWRNFVNTNGLGGQHLKADGGDVYKSKIARLYKVKRMPHVYLVDKNGRVVFNSATDAGNNRVVDIMRSMLY